MGQDRKYMDRTQSPRERAKALLAELSLEEKMAQVGCVFPQGEDKEELDAQLMYGIGQVSTLCVREMKSPDEAVQWQIDMQTKVMEHSPHRIPAVFHMEALCGPFIQDSVSLPSGIARASSWDTALEEELGAIVGRQELAFGVTQPLAPVLDISRDSRMGRQGESYGEDAALASAMGCAFARGLQKQRIAGRRAEACAKHFVGSHNTQGAIHGAHCDIPPRLLREVYAKPFQAAVAEEHLRAVMPCYCAIDGEPASASEKLLTGLLREELGFDGVCLADYGAVGNVHRVQHVGESGTAAGLMCMEAGMDVEMPCVQCFDKTLAKWFRDGKADMEILDRAVERVLAAKFRMGLFEHPFALTGEAFGRAFYKEDDQEKLLLMAMESVVLLKNDGVLPLGRHVKRIAVVGCQADNARIFFGGYTHESMMEAVLAAANSLAGVQPAGGRGADREKGEKDVHYIPGTQIQSDEAEEFDAVLKRQKPTCQSLLEALRRTLSDREVVYAYGYPVAGEDSSGVGEAYERCKGADLILMTLGGKNGSCSVASMGEGVDGANINLPACQDACIERLAELGIPMVGVHFDGRPISSDTADRCLDAILECWNPAECGAEAVVNILTGKYNPGGRLPVSVARTAGQLPVYYNHPNGSSWHQGESIGFQNYVDLPHTPRYFFGYGMSYTQFAYRNLRLDKRELAPDERVTVAFELANVGERDGDEVAQLYFCDKCASAARPVKELAGFARVHLSAGETKQVRFELKASQTAFLDRNMCWKVEQGEVELQIGASSEDIRLSESIWITSDAWMEGRERAFYARASVSS